MVHAALFRGGGGGKGWLPPWSQQPISHALSLPEAGRLQAAHHGGGVAARKGGGGRRGTAWWQSADDGGVSVRFFCSRPSDHHLLSGPALISLATIGPDHQPGLGTPPMYEFCVPGP